MSKRLPITAAAAFALAASAAAGPALAGGQTTQFNVDGSALVRGGAPIPQFHLNFLLNDPGRLQAPGSSDNLEISFSSPDNSVFRFLFSPRPQFGLSTDRVTGNRGYAGLTWTLFDSGSLFGNIGLAGSYDSGSSVPNDPLRRPIGSPLMLHGALELGYHLGSQYSLSLSVDQGRAPELRLGGETTDNLRLRYGMKF